MILALPGVTPSIEREKGHSVGVWRKWIFPIIRILVFAAIAAALVKLAFFPDVAVVSDPAVPGAEIVEPQVPVTLGTVQNDVTLQGTVSADPAVPAKAPAMGAVHKVFLAQGQSVTAGTVLMTIWTEVPRENGTVWYKESKVTAPTTGILSSLPVIVDQQVSVGEAVAQVAPASFHVSGSLQPEQQYRLLDQPTEAMVAISGGPAPFACTGLTITTPLPGSGGEGGTSGGTTVTCAVPPEVRVFAGLAAELTIAGGIAENVLVVPVTAVEGTAETGNVYFVLPDGTTELRPVVLGLGDGISVEVKEGLSEGDLILQFIPGAFGGGDGGMMPGSPLPGEECKVMPDDSIVCEEQLR